MTETQIPEFLHKTTEKSLFLDALNCQNNTGKVPVWLMRQAGRYLPEYRALRKKLSFKQMMQTPEVAAEVTLQPIQRFKLDAAIIFSDILVIPDALGLNVEFVEGVGPVIERPLNKREDIEKLPQKNISLNVSFVKDAIKLVKKDLSVPLIGFCGAPFTVAFYMIEGKTSKNWEKTKKWMLQDPQSFHTLLSLITKHSISYLKEQIAAGALCLQLFDSWASILSPYHFNEFCLTYFKEIQEAIKPSKIPLIYFCRGSSVYYPAISKCLPNAIGLDWQCDLKVVRQQIPKNIALQGNLDPDILLAPKQEIIKQTKLILGSMKNDPAYIFNLGHGIKPNFSVDAVKILIDTVKQQSN